MYTSVMLLALSGLVGVADEETLAWQNDYSAAQKQGETQNKPLAVFLAPGENGWNKLSGEGGLDKDIKQLLTGKYIPVHVNTDTDAGKQLARAFAVTGGKGIVISDRTGHFQAFWHEGSLPNQQLVSYLQRFADPQLDIHSTETNPSQRTSYYGPAGAPGASGFQAAPVFYPSAAGRCSTCR